MADNNYEVRIISRNGLGQAADDRHATVTRLADGKQAVMIAPWRWLLRWHTRRAALDRWYRYLDRRDRKMSFKGLSMR